MADAKRSRHVTEADALPMRSLHYDALQRVDGPHCDRPHRNRFQEGYACARSLALKPTLALKPPVTKATPGSWP